MKDLTSTVWLHGTMANINITEWAFPPPPSAHKPELTPHTAVFLTTDRTLALSAGPQLYSARIRPEAKVIDLRLPSSESEKFRQTVVQGKYGQDHAYATRDYWTSAWQQGMMMRFGSIKPHRVKENERIMQAKHTIDQGNLSPELLALWLHGQNMTREWIEEIVVAGRQLGYDAIIGLEPDSYRPSGPVVCEVLFALNSRAITSPVIVP